MNAAPARVYWNLHKKVWSVQGYVKGRGWIVLFHMPELWMENVTFKVSEAGRQRVIRTRRKNVHAYAVGFLCDIFQHSPQAEKVSYNPYRGNTFVDQMDAPVHSARWAHFTRDRKVFACIDPSPRV